MAGEGSSSELGEIPPPLESEMEAEEDERNPRGSWEGSYITQADIDKLRRRRQIPDGVVTRVPPEGQIQPEPEEGEYVVFAAHFDRGFGLPVSSFGKRFFELFHL